MTVARSARSHVLTTLLAATYLAGGMVAGTVPASSQDADKTWTVTNALRGEWKKKSKKFDESKDVSGLACATTALPRLCLIVDDETQGAQIVILRDGELVAGDSIPLIDDTFGKDKDLLELDAEGVAYVNGWFYVIGSHGRARHEKNDPEKEAENNAKAQATRRVFRIGFGTDDSVDMQTGKIKEGRNPKVHDSQAIGRIVQAQEKLKKSYDETLKDNGLTIEGIAATGGDDGKLYVGMRGPVLANGKSVILEVPIAAVFESQQGEAKVHELDLGKATKNKDRGVRDLVPHMGGFLILAGPEHDPEDNDTYVIKEGDYTVYSWDGSAGRPDAKYDLKAYGTKVKTKPEAILPLEEKAGKFRALVLFDGPENGLPTSIQVEMKPNQ